MAINVDELETLVQWCATTLADVKVSKPRKAGKNVRDKLLSKIRYEDMGHIEIQNDRLAAEDLIALIEDPGDLDVRKLVGVLGSNSNFNDDVKTVLRNSAQLKAMPFVVNVKNADDVQIESNLADGAVANHGMVLTTWHITTADLFLWSSEVSDQLGEQRGTTNHEEKTITLNYQHLVDDDTSSVVETVKHHIAHAKAGADAGHGDWWQFEARLLGLSNVAPCSDTTLSPTNPDAARGIELLDSLDQSIIDTLLLKFLKKFKQPFEYSGHTIADVMRMARDGELD